MGLYTLTVDLLARNAAFERDMGKSVRVVDRDMRSIRAAMSEHAARGADAAAAGFRRVAVEAIGMGSAIAIARNAVGRGDEWIGMNNRIRLVTDSQQAFVAAQQDVIRIAKATYQPLDATAGVYQNLAMVQDRLGLSGKQTARVVETVNKAVAMSGSSAAAAEGALIQFGQALASGTLRGEEFNSMVDGASKLVQTIEDGMGVARGSLRALVNDGGVSAQAMAEALLKMSGSVDTAFGAMQVRVSQSMTNLNTQITEMVGRADEAYGASALLAGGIDLLGRNLDVAAAAAAGLVGSQLVKALTVRLAAVNANTAADRASAAQSLANAQALELRTRAAVLDAQAEVRRAQAIGGSVSISAKAAAATLEHRQATVLLTQAQTQYNAASAGFAARGGAALLSALGGPVGIISMLAAGAAGWLLFRDGTNDAARSLADFSDTADVAIEKFTELNKQQQAGEILERQKNIEKGYKDITATIRDMALEAQRGITSSYSDEYAVSIRRLAEELQAGKIGADQFSAQLEQANEQVLQGATGADRFRGRMIEQTASAATLARENERQTAVLESLNLVSKRAEVQTDATTGAINRQAQASGEAAKAIDQHLRSLQGSIDSQIVNLVRLQKGAEEAFRVEIGQKINAAGGVDALSAKQREEYNRQLEIGLHLIRRQEAAQKAASGSKAADKAAAKSEKDTAEAMARYSKEAAIAAGTMSGPLAEAMAKHTQRMAELNEAMGKGTILQADAGVLMAQSAQEYAKVAAAAEKAQRAPAALLATMEQEVQLLGMAGPARELYRRQLMNESDMREEINRAMEAGAKFSQDEIAQLMERARAYAGVSMAMEEVTRAAEDWQQIAVDAVGGVADTFADVFDGQIKNAKDFFSELKDVFKRGWWDVVRTGLQQQFVNPIQKAIQGMLSGQGFAGAGTGYAGLGSTIAGGIVQGAQRAGIGSLGIGSTIGAAAGSIGGFGNNVAGFGGFQGRMYGFGGVAGALGGGGSGFGMPPGMGWFGKSLLTGEFAGGLPYAGAGLGLLGAYYGLTQRGSGGMSSVFAGASYGALGLGVGGAIAGGMGAIGAGVGIGGIGAGAAAGATGAMGAIGAASWVPVVGWALAALAVVDKISGGKVFGTKYKTDSSQQTIDVSEAGGVASATAEQSRQKALFGGKKRRTIDVDPGQEARDAAAGMHEVLAAYAKQLGVTLRQDAAALVGGSFSQTYDRKGNVTGSRSTVLGKSYDEDAETFQKRLAAEQAIAAVGKVDGQASKIAEDWRKSAELLEEGANFFVTAAVDARNGLDLWTGIGLSALTDYAEKMQAADETLSAAYTRLAGTAKSYGTLMADIATQVMTADLSGYQQQALNIERTYRQQVKSANDYAKALGLSGARAEDLAKIEELRALQMGKLQAQIEADKKNIKYGLSISDLSPLTDQEKLSEAMQALADATAKGDSQAAQQAAQAALGFGRNLYASGKDYNDLYGRVTSMIDGMKIGDLDLEDGTSMGQLADAIEALPEYFGKAIFEVAAGGKEVQKETNAKLDEQSQLLREQNQLLQKLLNTTQGAAATQKRESLNASLNAR
ncbi:tape measure protein [Stenotrophomonas sp.]|uniref:tape measure protein n=1 Tax=Stenotrophomonas sp. TaxID=69392 RepID=UPI0028AB793E|nr:tape measure protein [Stenotrophomonas sp.]